jgi:hypothetical protein
VIDEVDARHTMEYYNHILLELETVVPIVSHNPKEEAYEQCRDILMGLVSAIAFEELVKMACDRNVQVARYIGKTFKLEHNIKLLPILEMLLNHSHVKQVEALYLTVHNNANGNSCSSRQASDVSDVSDTVLETRAKNESQNISLHKKISETFVTKSSKMASVSYLNLKINFQSIKHVSQVQSVC